MSKVQFVTITENEEQQRIDNFLIARLKGVPKSHIYRILRKGEVRVNKKRIKAPYRLQLDDVVRIPPVNIDRKAEQAPINTNLAQVQQLESSILYESDRLIVLNKPSGMAVHGGSGLSFGVIEALRQLRPKAPFLELVHRLDRDTSGCLLVAKKRSALRFLHEQLRDKTMNKVYLAIVAGRWPKKVNQVDAPLLKNTLKSGERVVKVDHSGKAAKTLFRIQQKFPLSTLIECSPITGRTHQIRVHAQYIGCPILGDPKYADPQQEGRIRQQHKLNRLYLHAQKLEFREQVDKAKISITAPLDQDFEQLLGSLSQ